jgi:hypothetical protein
MEDAAANMIVHSPYLCLLYPVTAGLQGPALGSDEEEIVLLVFVIVDPDCNKVRCTPANPFLPVDCAETPF